MAEHLTAAPWEIPYPGSTGEVKLGATDMQEIAERTTTLFKEHVLLVKSYAGSATLKTGELAVQTKANETFTLPAATTANQVIGVFCGELVGVAKVTTSGGAVIYGDFVKGVGAITLAPLQHVVLQSDGTNWLIMAGEPKREQVYVNKVFTQVEAEAGQELSATRMVYAMFLPTAETLTIGGVAVAGEGTTGKGYLIPPGLKFRQTLAVNVHYLVL